MYDDPREDSWAAQAQWRRAVFGLTAVLLLGGSALAASPLARSSSKLVAPRAELRRQIAATSAVDTPVALRTSRTIGPHPAEATPTTSPAPQLIDATVHDVAEVSLVGVAAVPVLTVDVDPSAPGAADGGGDAPAPPPAGTQPAGTVATPPATVAAVAATPTTPPPTTPPPATTPPTPPTTPPPSPTTTPTPVAAAPVPADDTSSTVPDDGDDRRAGKHRGDKAEEDAEADADGAVEDDDEKGHGNKHERGDGGDDAETDDTADD